MDRGWDRGAECTSGHSIDIMGKRAEWIGDKRTSANGQFILHVNRAMTNMIYKENSSL